MSLCSSCYWFILGGISKSLFPCLTLRIISCSLERLWLSILFFFATFSKLTVQQFYSISSTASVPARFIVKCAKRKDGGEVPSRAHEWKCKMEIRKPYFIRKTVCLCVSVSHATLVLIYSVTTMSLSVTLYLMYWWTGILLIFLQCCFRISM